MTTDCPMIYKFNTKKFQEQNMSRTCQEHVVYTNCFECIKQKFQNLTKVSIVWYCRIGQNYFKSHLEVYTDLPWEFTHKKFKAICVNWCSTGVLLMFYWPSTDVLLMEFLFIINVNMPKNGMLYFGLIDAKIRASDIDLCTCMSFI